MQFKNNSMIKRKLKLLFAMLVISSVFNYIHAQSLKVTGTVTQKLNNKVLTGASVSLKKSRIAVATDSEGNFSISIPQEGGTLVVSYVG